MLLAHMLGMLIFYVWKMTNDRNMRRVSFGEKEKKKIRGRERRRVISGTQVSRLQERLKEADLKEGSLKEEAAKEAGRLQTETDVLHLEKWNALIDFFPRRG